MAIEENDDLKELSDQIHYFILCQFLCSFQTSLSGLL